MAQGKGRPGGIQTHPNRNGIGGMDDDPSGHSTQTTRDKGLMRAEFLFFFVNGAAAAALPGVNTVVVVLDDSTAILLYGKCK